MRKLFSTCDGRAFSLARIVVGVVYFAHGAQKMLGWFGGGGFSGTMAGMQQMGLPAAVVFMVIITEFFGGLGLIVGLLSRLAALGLFVEMLVAVFMVHLRNGFFMNWYGNQKGEGFEYHLLALSLLFLIMVKGSGTFSIDYLIGGRAECKKSSGA